MAELKMTIHGIGEGTCSLSGKEAECINVTIDGTIDNKPLSMKSFASIIRMKMAQNGKPAEIPSAPSLPIRPSIPTASIAPIGAAFAAPK